MPDYFKYVYLSSDSLHITLVLDFVLLQNFDGYFLSSENVSAKAHLAESPLTERPTFALGY